MSQGPWILPDFATAEWVEVNLDAQARIDFPATREPNPLLDPDYCDEWVRAVAARRGAVLSWGGWMEDRAHLWRGHYMRPDEAVHVGIDLNVPAGTRVLSPQSGVVVFCEASTEGGGGWGGWFVLRADEPRFDAAYVLLGHLAHDGLPAVGTGLTAGALAGHVGTAAENGGWYPHLHLQALSAAAWAAVADDPAERLDGYAAANPGLRALFPDPTPLAGLAGRN